MNIMGFEKFITNKTILDSLKNMGYLEPTLIQQQVLEKFNLGKNIVGQSQTGTGKTAAFVLPLLQAVDSRQRNVQTLILTPTRELATQVREEIYDLSKGLYLSSLAVYGQSSIFKQKQILMKGPQFVVGTPGRVCDLINRRMLKLDNLKYFVLDEVDRMLDMGFIEDIDYVWSHIKNLKQMMSFSATIPPELKKIISKYIGDDYDFIKATTEILVDKVDHSFIDVEKLRKYFMLTRYLEANPHAKILVFSQTKHNTKDLAKKLTNDGFRAGSLHGDLSQKNRFHRLDQYKRDRIQILIATDVAARGLNMNDVDLVVNYDVPQDPESYIHRIGRTARAGKSGKAIMFVSRGEIRLLRNVEKMNKIRIKKINENGEEVVQQDRDRRDHRSNNNGRVKYGYNKSSNRSNYSNRNSNNKSGNRTGGYGSNNNNSYKKKRENKKSFQRS